MDALKHASLALRFGHVLGEVLGTESPRFTSSCQRDAASGRSGGGRQQGFNLMRMAAAGLPVPPGFVLPAGWCGLPRATQVNAARLHAALSNGIARVEAATGLGFGSSAGHCSCQFVPGPRCRCLA